MPSPQIYVTQAANPGRSVFNLSYEQKTTTDMGMIIPICCKEAMPGDVFKIDEGVICRLMPQVAPILHKIDIRLEFYFAPYRKLWEAADPDNWEQFITGGDDGLQSTGTFPTWNPATKTTGSLWDYLNFPVGITPTDRYPSALPARAYTWIWNEWYRSQELQSEETIDLTGGVDTTDYEVLKRAWRHDYYTACLLQQQRGVAPALPISGIIDVDSANSQITLHNTSDSTPQVLTTVVTTANVAVSAAHSATAGARWDDTGMQVDLTNGTTFDIASLRLATSQQRYLERNNRAGARYTEWLKSHYGESPQDSRLDRPEMIGTARIPIQTQTIFQNSETSTTPQGTMAGSGMAIDGVSIGRYRVQEWGLIMGLLTILPAPAYQQGVDREWIKETRYDFYSPEFSQLSDQIVEEVEIMASATGANNTTLFGYIGAWDHYRTSHNKVSGYMRSGSSPDFSYWHLARHFSTRPSLNSAFITMDGEYASNPTMKRIFAVQDEQSFMLQIGNGLTVSRPLPFIAKPGGQL